MKNFELKLRSNKILNKIVVAKNIPLILLMQEPTEKPPLQSKCYSYIYMVI